MTATMRSTAFICAGLVSYYALTACALNAKPILSHSEGKTTGQIILSSPKVSTREALVNDRLIEARWLRETLNSSGNEDFGVQGQSVIKDFSGVAAGLALEAGPQVSAVNQAQSNLVNFLKGQNSLQQQQQDLTKTQLGIQSQSLANLETFLQKPENQHFVIDPATGKLVDLSKGESGTQVTQTTTTQAPTAVAPTFPNTQSQLATLEKQAGQLPAPSFTKPSVQSSPVDRFRDKVAYRQEIRNEILDNQLDDRHDLNGTALYRLKFEAQVIPANDTSAWAVIEVKPDVAMHDLRFPEDCAHNDKQTHCMRLAEIYERWVQHLEDTAQERLRTEVARISSRADLASIDPSLRPLTEREFRKLVVSAGLSRADQISSIDQLLKELQAKLAAEVKKLEDNKIISMQGKSALDQLDLESPNVPGFSATNARQSTDIEKNIQSQIQQNPCRSGDTVCASSIPRIEAIVSKGLAGKVADQQIMDILNSPLYKLADCLSYQFGIACVSAKAIQLVLAEKLRTAYPELVCVLLDSEGPSIRVTGRSKEAECGTNKWPGVLEKFGKKLNHSADKAQIFAYAATPREMVERVSQISTARDALNLAFLIQAASGKTLGKSYLEIAQEREGLFETLRRQPIVVGFSSKEPDSLFDRSAVHCASVDSDLHQCAEPPARFGWVIGPRFKLKNDGRQARFRHNVVQHGVAVQLVMPAWLQEVRFRVRTGWMREDGTLEGVREYRTEKVALPLDIAAVNSIARAGQFSPRLPERASTTLDENANQFDVDAPASIIVWGNNLFRTTAVSLGAQVTEDIQVMPGMAGIVANFQKVADPGGLDVGKSRDLQVRLWTSTGQIHVGAAQVRKKAKDADKPGGTGSALSVVFAPQVVVEYGKEYSLLVTDGSLPSSISSSSVRVKHDQHGWLPLQGARAQTSNGGKKSEIRFTLKLVGQDNNEVSRRTDLEQTPLTIGFFEHDRTLPSAISSTAPLLLPQGTSPNDPKLEPTCKVSKTKTALKISFEKTWLNKVAGFPKESYKVTATSLDGSPECKQSGPFECTATSFKFITGQTEIKGALLKNANGDSIGLKEFDCTQ